MAWVDVPNSTKNFFAPGWDEEKNRETSYHANQTVTTKIIYNDSSFTAEQLEIRLVCYTRGSGCSDKFDLLFNPTKAGRLQIHVDKGGSNKWNFTSSSIWIEKTYTDRSFSIPNYWVCNLGGNRWYDTATDLYNTYKTSWYDEHMRSEVAATTLSISEAVAKALSESDGSYINIQSNENNSFTIRAQGVPTQVADGKNNPVKSAKLTCTGLTGAINCSTEVTKTVYLPSNTTGDGYGVTAEIVTDATYGPDVQVSAAVLIPNYIAPTKPTKVQLANSSYKNGRLTTKQPWTFTWNPAEGNNDYSPVAGYSFRLYKNGEAVDRIFCSGNELILDASGQDTASRDLTAYSTCELVIDPVLLGFEPKDTVQLGVQAYARNGLGKTTWSLNNNTYKYSLYSGDTGVHVVGENETKSTEYEVENAGVVKVKTPDHGWVEGQVWVKDASGWCEAETVLVKTPDGWMESQ